MGARSASRAEAAKVQRWLDVIAALLRRSPQTPVNGREVSCAHHSMARFPA